MIGTESVAGPIAVRVGVAIIQRLAPSGITLVKSWLKGKEILVVGQSRAGKTTFIDYLQYGLFEAEKHTEKTTDHVYSPRFNIKIGRDSALELFVKRTVDIPGQWGAVKHADIAFDRNPHVLVVMVDATAPLRANDDRSASMWLKEFIKRLELKWRIKKTRSNRMKVMVVLMNKSDKANSGKLANLEQRIRQILDAEFREGRGKMKEDVAIMQSCMVINPKKTQEVDSVISFIAKALAK